MSVQLNELARTMVGDGGWPNLFFVCDGSACKMVTSVADEAYAYWRKLMGRYPLAESCLEDRLTGVLATVCPKDEDDSPLEVRDEFRNRRKMPWPAKFS